MPSPNPILPITTKKVSSSNGNSSFLDPSPLISPPKPQILDYPQPRLLIAPHSDEQIQISTTLATTTTNTAISPSDSYQQRRRRISSDSSLPSLFDSSAPRQSVSSHVSQAPAERHFITKLFVKLFSCLRVGYRVITLCLALGCYNLMLLPGFIQVGCYYFSSKQILRGIVYGGDRPRNRLDLYLPKNIDTPKPVVAFVTGGAWIIGYKAWGALLGKQLSERDIIVACIDYRNFPQSTISDMVKDASEGISFVFNKIAQYGGDPNRIYLMGQSAGAHISACALVEQAIKEANQEEISWSVSQIKAYFGLSGGYNLFNLAEHFDSRGFYRSLFVRIMEGEESLARFSPEVMVQDPNLKTAVSLLPPIFLFHGSADYTILSDQSTNFAETLKRVGFRAETILYEGKTHTDVFVQDPMRGGKDQMLEDLVAVIHADDAEAQAKDAVAPRGKRMVPECMIQIARKVSPF